MMRGVAIVLAAAAVAVFLWVVSDAWTASPGAAKERSYAAATVDAAAGPLPAVLAQDGGIDQDDRLPVQLWTLVAAGGAAGLGLLLFLVRLAMGWVKRPPPQEESHH